MMVGGPGNPTAPPMSPARIPAPRPQPRASRRRGKRPASSSTTTITSMRPINRLSTLAEAAARIQNPAGVPSREPTTAPVISLYLDGRPDQHGREQYGVFVRKELAAHSRRWPLRSAERESFHRDVERILAWLHDEVRPSANGLAILACAAANDFFE